MLLLWGGGGRYRDGDTLGELLGLCDGDALGAQRRLAPLEVARDVSSAS